MKVERYYTRRNSNCLSDFFFKAKLTQTGLSCAIELFAIEKLLEYNKTWFCSYCVKLIGELNESTQRNCIICNRRYYFKIYLQNDKFNYLNF